MFSSTWGQQNQQQQQPQQPQQQTGAFGQPTAFGATTSNNNNAFGSTSAFAQPQQQQPQVNPMFGNIGAPSTSAFGPTNNNANTSAFGVKPATGFGAFSGGTGAFGGGTTAGTFGQPVNNQASTSTSVFGAPANTNTPSAFGTFNKTFGGTAAAATPPVVTTGTSNPPYVVTTEKDQNVTLQFNAISCMPQYVGYSAEELRVQDYAQGRKTATTTTGAFGQPTTAFGATQQTNTGLFGGQPAQQTAPLFGGTGTTNTTNPSSTFGAFGQPLNQPSTTNTGNLFGGGAFGQQQQQQPQQQQQQQQQPQQQQNAFGGGNAFGQQQQQQPNAFSGGTSVFGNNAPKPAFTPFGGGGGTTNIFGGSTPSAFGNTQQQTPQPSQNLGAFGNTQPANNASPFGAFGTSGLKPSVFGTQSNATQPAFGTFGNPQPQQNQPNQQPSIFGNNTLFGNQQQQPQNQQQGAQPNQLFGGSQNPAPLFGNATSNTGNIFGNNQQGQQQQPQQQGQLQTGNAFGGLFGNKPIQPNAPLFGSGQPTNQNQQNAPLFGSSFGQSTQPNSLFANKAAAPMLGNSFSGSQGMSTGIFGASANLSGAQGTMTASISQPIGENLPIFAMLPPGPRILNLEQNSPKKKGGFFVDIPTRSPVPRVLGYTPANSKLRGYGSSLSSSTTGGGNALNGSMSLATGKPNALSLTKTDNSSRAMSLGPDGFLGRSGSPALGSGGRESVKKVVLDKKIDATEFFVKSGSPSTLRSGKITFTPALGLASRERQASAATLTHQHLESPTPAPRTNRSPNRFTAQSAKDVSLLEGDEQPVFSEEELKKGDYSVKPDLQTLKNSGHEQLSVCEGLVVSRKGYGEIQFLEPVDLTGLPKLGALLGQVIRFDDKECSVYPDSEEVDKPPPGSGLNVKARLSLEGCWAVDKATREPITDPSHPSAVKHLKRLKNMKDTHFDSFDMKTGTWTFTVDHF